MDANNSSGDSGSGESNRDTSGDFPGRTELNMEDYGHDDSDPTLTREEGAATSAGRESGAEQSSVGGGSQSGHTDLGGYSGGTEGVRSGGHQGEMFGEFENTDTGTDLTVDMMNTDAREGVTEEDEPGE